MQKVEFSTAKVRPTPAKHKATETADQPGVEKAHDEREHQPGEKDRRVVTMLPHHDRILPEARGIFFVENSVDRQRAIRSDCARTPAVHCTDRRLGHRQRDGGCDRLPT